MGFPEYIFKCSGNEDRLPNLWGVASIYTNFKVALRLHTVEDNSPSTLNIPHVFYTLQIHSVWMKCGQNRSRWWLLEKFFPLEICQSSSAQCLILIRMVVFSFVLIIKFLALKRYLVHRWYLAVSIFQSYYFHMC